MWPFKRKPTKLHLMCLACKFEGNSAEWDRHMKETGHKIVSWKKVAA